jgi:acyl carrier protein
MERSDIERTLKEIVLKNSRLKVASVSTEDTLTGDLGFDSLAFLTLISDLEETFGIPFPVEDVDEWKDVSFGRLAEMIQERVRSDVGHS